ncbi:GntR family transcriptional regulator [Sulfitobacter aestuariivivens]|uniref:GntR family transcriptional regulator n=1 Tax=Sulfitobacter aestuariivivens TaxID=2766981 RepID=A0A927D6N3_9RHOB|nr:GntR family transcriptional regulator [Sulfitobacter aestuariivivens]MBD3665188.1 GntR family transcriptional regulator [Sulfitobacter aestuariivivens]
MALRSITTQRRRLADEVYDQLVNAIMSREIGPDDRLVQEKLAAELDISRTPVREALLRLEKEGVLHLANSGGFRLAKISEEETLELYQARAAIEGQAARILAARNDPAEMKQLRATIRENEKLSNPSTQDYFAANRSIHRAFMEMAGNRFLLEMFDMIWGRAMAFHLFAAIENTDIAKSLGNHMALVDALETGDRATALEVFTAHIQDGFELHLDGIRRTP